jgi:RNA polymerase sigma-70 factor (ECF subfamily)
MTASEEVPNNGHLVKEALSGEDGAFTELVRRRKRQVLNIVTRYMKNHYELDDICQEIFIKVYKNQNIMATSRLSTGCQ